ncbi:MAG: ABC transporter substrate-binding protein [Candidatus Izemoplasmatales bacterium]
MKKLTLILLIFLTFNLVGCKNEKDNGITVTDMAGTEVVVPSNIRKVAAVSPSTADLMIAFGLGDKIDGVYKTVTDNEWATTLYPKAKDFYKYDYDESAESYFSRGVDLILLPDPTTVESLRTSGLTVLNIRQFASGSFDNYLFTFSEILKQIFPEVTDKVNAWQSRMNNALNQISDVLQNKDDKPTLYYIYGDKLNSRGSHLAYTDMPNSFVASLLRKLNVKFVSDNFTSNRPSEEEVLQTNPDIIVIGGIYQKFLYDELLNNDTWNKLDAVVNERVYNIPVGFAPFEQNSIESPIFLYDLANKIYPELFNYDIKAITKETLQFWFDVTLTEQQIDYLLDGLSPTGQPLVTVK